MPFFYESFIFKHISFQWYGWSNFYILHPWCSGTRCPLFWPSQLASIHYIELILHILGFINLLIPEIYLIHIQMQYNLIFFCVPIHPTNMKNKIIFQKC